MFYVFKLLYREYQNSPQILNLDKRFCHWPLAGSPWPMVALITMYLLFVLKLGPKFMERRPPYDVKKLMQIYNIIQILANIYVVVYGSKHILWNPDFKWLCQEFDLNDYSPNTLAMRYPSYVYYICKYLDFLDTVFFVLRKKHNQVTFLHVYHHVMMVFASWVYHQRFLGTHFSYVGIINAFIHVIMYIYYFTAALDIKLNLYECKRRLTQLQIIQFLGLSILFATPLCMSNCNLNRFWLWVASIQDFFVFLLFADFYRKTYRKPKKATVPTITASTSQSGAANSIPAEHTKQP